MRVLPKRRSGGVRAHEASLRKPAGPPHRRLRGGTPSVRAGKGVTGKLVVDFTGAALLAGDEAADAFLLEFVRILVINAVLAVLLVFIPNRLLLVGRLPLGYWPPLVWAVMYGVTIGTNSFSIAEAGRPAPSLPVFGRSGLYEIAAYCLLAAATHGISVSRSPSILTMRAEPNVPRPSLLDGVHWTGVAAAAVLPAAACAWEAHRIMARF